MTEKSECPFVKAHQCAQGVSYYYFWRCVGHWLNYKSFFGEGKTILNFILFFTKWIFQITPSRFPPNVQEIIFQMVLSSSTKYILLMELKETQLMHIPWLFFFFFISALGENQNLKFFIKDTSAEVDILYYIKDI